ncbi:hypothetical protein JCM10213v2_007941 [Rhodosporidiobolus nylandii]
MAASFVPPSPSSNASSNSNAPTLSSSPKTAPSTARTTPSTPSSSRANGNGGGSGVLTSATVSSSLALCSHLRRRLEDKERECKALAAALANEKDVSSSARDALERARRRGNEQLEELRLKVAEGEEERRRALLELKAEKEKNAKLQAELERERKMGKGELLKKVVERVREQAAELKKARDENAPFAVLASLPLLSSREPHPPRRNTFARSRPRERVPTPVAQSSAFRAEAEA